MFVQQSTKSYGKNAGETIYQIWAKNSLQYLCLPSRSTVGTPEIYIYIYTMALSRFAKFAVYGFLFSSHKQHQNATVKLYNFGFYSADGFQTTQKLIFSV